jgi:hypothetical protein
MSKPNPQAHSVMDRLRLLATQRREDFNALLARYGNERFLFRLGSSPHRQRFVLKGAMLFVAWLDRIHRPTRDVDLLGLGEITPETIRAMFTDICACGSVDEDGVTFDPTTIAIAEIRENQTYHGLRVTLLGHLGSARINLQVDIGVGDAVTPSAQETDYPTLLGHAAPRLNLYPRESVIAEKLDAMLQLGLRNSRMKDFHDCWLLITSFSFAGSQLAEAIQRTCARRATTIRADADCFGESFAHDPAKQIQWAAFRRRSSITDSPHEFPVLMEQVRSFLLPPVRSVVDGSPFTARWPAGGPWQLRSRK